MFNKATFFQTLRYVNLVELHMDMRHRVGVYITQDLKNDFIDDNMQIR